MKPSRSSSKSAKGFGASRRSDRSGQGGRSPQNSPDLAPSLAPYVRTLPQVIDAMLELGQVTAADCVYDLGCGDGRMLLTAAQQRGVGGLGVDIDPERIQEANAAARELGLSPQIRFQQQDLLSLDLSPATVVMFYLLPQSNLRLRQKLQTELAPGSRILTHSFDMGDWPPTRTAQVSDVINTYNIYLWQV
ncbi:MAG: class I SAM-dependent methyltransferase [Synechococcales bacterium]|nr:class I SAM-dependent methyltransferase [Synechococcales bacterium]